MKNKGYISRLIFYILTNDIPSRDDWMIVVKKVHDMEMLNYNIKVSDYYDALFSYKLTNPQTISRIWRKIQEHNPSLRGEEWLERQKMGGMVAKEIVDGRFTQLNLF